MASKNQGKEGSRSQSEDEEDRGRRKQQFFDDYQASSYGSSDEGKYSVLEFNFVNFDFFHLKKLQMK